MAIDQFDMAIPGLDFSISKLGRIVPSIIPRRMGFSFADVKERYFYKNNSILSAHIAALSGMFPPGEKKFIESVRAYREEITDPELLSRVSSFIKQEGHHSHQHKRINQALDDLGMLATRVEESLERRIERDTKHIGRKNLLASTVCMEHLTAVLAEFLLTHQYFLEPLTPSVRELLLWHAAEEIEHKSVAFDVYESCVGERRRLHIIMGLQTVVFMWELVVYQTMLLFWAKKIPNIREMKDAFTLFFGKDGVFPRCAKSYFSFYRRDFHPWDIDNASLVDEWKVSQDDFSTAALIHH